MTVRTRFAPSPTGFLHIGGLRTALYAYFLAKKEGGQMILRIEDTDRARLVEGALEAMIQALQKMGVNYDEGPFIEDGNVVQKGDAGPYIQSERLDLYKTYVDQLLENGHAYRCFCTAERLEAMREEQRATKQQPKYDRTCCKLSPEEVTSKMASGEPFVVRMKIPEGETIIEDLVYGKIVFNHNEIDDQVILKSDGFPTYHLAVVVDDHLMNITHMMRGEDWITSTPKQVILYNMLGWEPVQFAHLPNLLGENKKKLSKRQGDVAVEAFLEKGYLPEAINNFVATLGFNPKGDQELYSMDEFAELFDLSRVNRGGAVVNYEKLDWMNNQYLKAMAAEDIHHRATRWVTDLPVETERCVRAIEVEKGRLTRLDELPEVLKKYEASIEYDAAILVWKKSDKEGAKHALEGIRGHLQGMSEGDFDAVETIEASVKGFIEQKGWKNGDVLWPMRVALSGQERSPSPFELAWVFGKIEALRRIEDALSRLS